MIEEHEMETLTIEDLERVFFRAQDEHGKWESVDAKEATDAQFDHWAKSHLTIVGEDAPWTLAERANFCNQLYQAGMISVLKKGVSFEE